MPDVCAYACGFRHIIKLCYAWEFTTWALQKLLNIPKIKLYRTIFI